MSATKRFLAPKPPNLYPVTETQAFSGSTTSFSSSSSSTSSACFDKLSRGSSASAYLTDATPPISPSHSNLDLDLKDGSVKEKPSSVAAVDRPPQPYPSSMDGRCDLRRSVTASQDDLGYASDDEADSNAFDAVAAIRMKLMRAKPSINTRRALKIMERRGRPQSQGPGSEDSHTGTPSKPVNVVITEAGESDVEDWSRDFEIGTSENVQIRVPTLDHPVAELRATVLPASGSGTTEGCSVSSTSGELCALRAQLEQDFIPAGNEPDIISPQMPTTPIIRPLELDWDCSPFSLGSPSLPSSNSIYRQIVSPLNLDASDTNSPPAVYNDSFSFVHGNSPLCSPLGGISTRMFSSHCNHRSFPLALDGENLGTAALIRLEVAGTLRRGIQPTREPQPLAGLGFGMLTPSARLPPTPDSSFPSIYDDSFGTGNECDFSCGDVADISSDIPQRPPPVHREHDPSGPPLEITGEDEQDQPISGLGLGYIAERSLCSSSSVSRLASDSIVNGAYETKAEDTHLGGLADPQSSPGLNIAVEDNGCSEVEPSVALSQQQSNIAYNLERMPISPHFFTKPRKRLPHPPAPNDEQNQQLLAPVIEPPQAFPEKNTQVHRSDADPTPNADFTESPRPPSPQHVVQPPQNASTGIDYLPKPLTAEHLDLLDRYAEIYQLSPIPEHDTRDNKPHETLAIAPPALLEKNSRVHLFEVFWDNPPVNDMPAVEYPLLTQNDILLLQPNSERQVLSLVDVHLHRRESERHGLSPIAEQESRYENTSDIGEEGEIDDNAIFHENYLAGGTTTPVPLEFCSPMQKKLTKIEKERIERWAHLHSTIPSLHILGSECDRAGVRSVREPPESSSPTCEQDDFSHLGMSRFTLTPENDPRSPCSPAVDQFRQDRHISGCQTTPSEPTSSGFTAASLLMQENSPRHVAEPPSTILPSSSSADPSTLGESKSSKSIDGLGIGLPSDLSSRPLRQRDLSSSCMSTTADDGLSGLPTTRSCLNLAQLADAPSPNCDPDAIGEPSPQQQGGGSSPFFKIARFAKRILYVIPEQATPSPTLSPCRQRISTPFNWPSSPPWSDFSVLNRLRSPTWLSFSTPRTGSSSSRGSHGGALSSEPPVNVEVCPRPKEDVQSAPPKSNNLLKTYFNRMARRNISASSTSPSQPAGVKSPGVIEHPDVSPSLGIFNNRSSRALPNSGKEGRLKPSLWKFKVLF